MHTFLISAEFNDWLSKLRDQVAKARIIHRIRSAEQGNFGDCEAVGEGISEMRVHVGAGYRIYYTRRAQFVYLVLCGGDKSSQKRDIKRAKALMQEFSKEDTNDKFYGI
jgi:putative addiction module killer protein